MAEDRITAALRGPAPDDLTGQRAFPMYENGGAQQGQDGTAQSGYVTPDLGPFECENCTKFQPPNQCSDERVISDPEVQGQVEPEGCCNFFQSAHNESQAEEHGEAPDNPPQEQ